MPVRNRAMVVAQAGLGLRVGELLGLRVTDVDFLRRTVEVQCQITRQGGTVRAETKTPHSQRSIPLPQVVADALSAHLATYGPGSDGSLFATVHGNPYRSDYYDKLFRATVARTTLPKGTSSHDLRHHYASVLLAAGESVVAVAARLGHENAALVLSTYGHLMPDSEDRTRRAVDDAWCAPRVPRSDSAAG
jgi:integrase